MEKIKVKITTSQTIDEAGNEDVMELVTEATRSFEEDSIIINYDESEITENEGTKTRLKIYKNKLIMTKVGFLSSKMEFEKGKKYNNIYSTPYGNFDINFDTRVYDNQLNEHGKGSVFIEYSIIFGNADESYNKLKIDIY